jgi:hypothetical protein
VAVNLRGGGLCLSVLDALGGSRGAGGSKFGLEPGDGGEADFVISGPVNGRLYKISEKLVNEDQWRGNNSYLSRNRSFLWGVAIHDRFLVADCL